MCVFCEFSPKDFHIMTMTLVYKERKLIKQSQTFQTNLY